MRHRPAERADLWTSPTIGAVAEKVHMLSSAPVEVRHLASGASIRPREGRLARFDLPLAGPKSEEVAQAYAQDASLSTPRSAIASTHALRTVLPRERGSPRSSEPSG